jgi:CRP-like cAMP-binding protein
VELALLPGDVFRRLLAGSPPTGESLARTAEDRRRENLALGGGA